MADPKLILGDCLNRMRELPEASVSAIVTDPPYELGFMGKKWDSQGSAHCIEIWQEALRVAKPGAHLLAFAAPRTEHRMICAIEDAGWEVRDKLMWLYGQGFPKAKTALKPAYEPICLARKPFDGTVVANVLEHGTGAINVDACMVEGVPRRTHGDKNIRTPNNSDIYGEYKTQGGEGPLPKGRWPANLILDEDAGAMLDEQSGASRFFYCAKASKSERGEGNDHPTVKPIRLMQYLVRLITPPDGTVLDPFMGSGTTGIACVTQGFDFIGIEQDAHDLEISSQRIEQAREQGSLWPESL